MDTQQDAGRGPGIPVITCPLCEHVQAGGAECEVCGRALLERVDAAIPVATLPELEPTAFGDLDGPVLEEVGEPLELLETTAFAWSAPVPGEGAMTDLERNQAAPVEVALDHTPDMETHLAEPVADEAPLAMGLRCRYCQAEALPGEVLCGRCGVRLPIPLAPERAPAGGPTAICSCGAPVSGSLCPACGARRA